MALSIGIVGLPNVGKSTLFSALTGTIAQSANYAFSTVEANVGIVPVPDARLGVLADMVKPEKVVPATVEFHDIAGLAKGASQGAGLGNRFLASIRDTDAIVEVVRYFDDENVVHFDGGADPTSDVETLKLELVFADMATMERGVERLEREAKKDKTVALRLELAQRMLAWLEEGHRARSLEMSDEERVHIREFCLLTMKPHLYVANIDELQMQALSNGDWMPELLDGVQPVAIAARVEADLVELGDEEAAEYLSELGAGESGLQTLIREAYHLLGLQSFFTAGPMEVRAWTVRIGAKAPQAAGVIHSDFERGFIKAEVVSYDDYVSLGGEKGARDVGRLRLEGKEYIVQDGDVIHFKFNV